MDVGRCDNDPGAELLDDGEGDPMDADTEESCGENGSKDGCLQHHELICSDMTREWQGDYTDRAGGEDNKQSADTKRDVVIAGDNVTFRRLMLVALILGTLGTSCTMSNTTVSLVVK